LQTQYPKPLSNEFSWHWIEPEPEPDGTGKGVGTIIMLST